MRRSYFVAAISLVAILGVVFGDAHIFFDSTLKTKWYWYYIAISILGMSVPLWEVRSARWSKSPATETKRPDKLRRVAVAIFAAVAISAALVALHGIAQYAGVLPAGRPFKVVGNFDNPAGYASMLALSLPFVLYYTTVDRRKVRLGAWVVYGLCIVGIAITESRTGILTALTLTTFHAVNKYQNFITRASPKVKWFTVSIAALIAVGLYFVKQDSTNGRILIWQCTWDMINDKPLMGHGYKNFEAEYMLYQASYFAQNPDSRFALLADNVKHPFNEYLLMAAEFGTIALISASILITLIIRVYIRNKNKELAIFISAIFGIFIFSCFSYPFKYPFTWMILGAGVLYILANPNSLKRINRFISRSIKIAIPLLSLALLAFTVKDMYYENKWYNMSDNPSCTDNRTIVSEYEQLLPYFKRNGYFLYNYAAQLNHLGEYERSLNYANEAVALLNDYDIQMLIADNYHNLSMWDKSMTHYVLASQMCPNRFMPLYRMATAYSVRLHGICC